jgi:long-subunit acyl-CoA synthetase (AMP-forming)
MTLVSEAIASHARQHPTRPALLGADQALGYAQLHSQVSRTADQLLLSGARCLAIDLDNGPLWAILDLAAQLAEITLVPIPAYFSAGQLRHTLECAGVEAVICENPRRYTGLDGMNSTVTPWELAGGIRYRVSLAPSTASALPMGTSKITFTSGSTGTPKGVCLSAQGMERVCTALAAVTAASASDRHLCLLPLPTLLENIGGLYVPLLAGACTILPPLADVGLNGSSQLDPQRMAAALAEHEASTAITVPAMLRCLLAALAAGAPRPQALRYLAVGGAAIAPQLLEQAEALGLPVRQGYGLSECASVVAVNSPADNRIGSVGGPLPHVQLEFADDGEILIRDPGFLGYLGSDEASDGLWPTGDLGRLDADGFLHLTGRKKNIFITAFGRNVSPEWVEAELTAQPALLQATVFGEGRPWNSAVIVSRASDAEVETALAAANAGLPDYAQVRRWLRASTPFLPDNGQATANGRPRRDAIHTRYAGALEALYAKE